MARSYATCAKWMDLLDNHCQESRNQSKSYRENAHGPLSRKTSPMLLVRLPPSQQIDLVIPIQFIASEYWRFDLLCFTRVWNNVNTMAFNHYAKIKRILDTSAPGWFVCRIDEPTSAKNFRGETRKFDHYYRIYAANNKPIPYCKFQQLDLFAKIMNINVNDIPIEARWVRLTRLEHLKATMHIVIRKE